MAAPDMDVIKEIPGYKVILKAILKSQIQQLVEQLASSTDEESVILTASVADGTLCHLGSNSGKVFLEDHEDIKSQFLGFCLKRHHKQKQEKEKQEAQEREEALARSMAPTTPPRYGGMGPRPGYMSQRSPRYSAPHPMTLTRASPNAGIRAQGVRHHPYQANRPTRPRLSLDQQNWSPGQGPGPIKMPEGQVIKIEPDDNDENADKAQTGAGADSSQPSSPSVKPTTPSSTQGPGASDNDDAKSESSSSTIPNEALEKINDNIPTAGLSLDSDLSNLIKASTSDTDPNASQSSITQDSNSAPENPVQYDPNIGVKLEAVTDAEMDLEITGVELGQRPAQEPMGSPNWMPNISMQGASGSAADMSGYSLFRDDWCTNTESYSGRRDKPQLFCELCGLKMNRPSQLVIHMRTHTGEKPFVCQICNKAFKRKYHLKTHMAVHSKDYQHLFVEQPIEENPESCDQ